MNSTKFAEALALHANHGKALYRRAQAFEALGNFGMLLKVHRCDDFFNILRCSRTGSHRTHKQNSCGNGKQTDDKFKAIRKRALSTDNVNGICPSITCFLTRIPLGLLNTLGDASKESKHDEAIVKLVISSKDPRKQHLLSNTME